MATALDVLEMQRRRNRHYHWMKKEHVNPPSAKQVFDALKTSMVVEVPILNENDRRYGQTVTTPVYQISALAKVLGKSNQAVHDYEARGIIPEPIIDIVAARGNSKRGYTGDQVRAAVELSPLLNFTDARGIEYAAFSRELWSRWAAMPDGVVVELKEGVASDAPVKPAGRIRRRVQL